MFSVQEFQRRVRAAGRRWRSGAVRDASVALEMAFEAGGLSARERYVIRQRLCGRSFGEIAADPELGDGPAALRGNASSSWNGAHWPLLGPTSASATCTNGSVPSGR